MKPPVVSVLFSVYNGADYLREAINSILNQTYREFEFIIIDDGSTDATPQILDEFTDTRIIRLRNDQNLGLVISLNKALAVAKGKIIARMDADDISLPDRFQKQLAYLERHPEVGVLGTAMNQVGAGGELISVLVPPTEHAVILWQTLFSCAIFHATVMMRRSVVMAVGGYDVNFVHSEDLELWSRLFSETRFANLSEILYIRRLHQRSVISTQSFSQHRNGILIRQRWLRSILGYPVAQELVAWLFSYDHALTPEQKLIVVKILQDLYGQIVIETSVTETQKILQSELVHRIGLVRQSAVKFCLRRAVSSLGQILPSPLRHKIKMVWQNFFGKSRIKEGNLCTIMLVMNNFVIGGVEKLLYDIVARLDRREFKIVVVTVFGAGPLENQFRALNIPLYFAAGKLPFFTDKWWYKILWVIISPLVFIRLAGWLKYYRPAVVVTSLYQADILGILAGWLLGVKKRILIHHDVYRIGWIPTKLKKIFGVGLATTVVAVSKIAQDFVINYFGAKPNRVRVIHNGIDVGKFQSSDQPHSQLVVGMLGRLEPVKGPAVFVESLRILHHKFHILPLSFIAGEGSLKDDLINYAKQNQLGGLVFDGEIQNVPGWLKKIDILVVPSVSEGFGLVALEGLAAHKVVVASDLPAMRELIIDGENGCLFPSGSAERLADTLWLLLTNREFLERVKAGMVLWRPRSLPDYDISRVTQSYENLFLSNSDDQVSAGQIRP